MKKSDSTTVAVIIGGFTFDVPAFHRLFRSLSSVEAYIQDLYNFAANQGNHHQEYDVVLFFHHYVEGPPADGGVANDWQDQPMLWHKNTVEAIQSVVATGKGVVVLHHAISMFRQWEFWSDLVGIPHKEREWEIADWKDKFDQIMHIEIVKNDHPITKGLSNWDVENEAWLAFSCKPAAECEVLMVTDHPDMSFKAMAWTHEYKGSRVYCLQPGHGPEAWQQPAFKTVLERGIHWAAKRI
jgi:hypothetical protein